MDELFRLINCMEIIERLLPEDQQGRMLDKLEESLKGLS